MRTKVGCSCISLWRKPPHRKWIRRGRILIPGRLRKVIPIDEDQEIVLVGMYHRLEIWNPSEWRRYIMRNEENFEQNIGKLLNLL